MRVLFKRRLREAVSLAMLTTGGMWLSAAVVYYDNSVTNWSSPHAHAWNSKSETTTWPGESMTKVDGYDNLWKYDTGSYKNVLFDDGRSSDGLQTDDLVAVDGKVYKMITTSSKGDMAYFSSIEEWVNGIEQGGGNEGGNEGGDDNDMVWISPKNPNINQEVTITFDASKSSNFNNTAVVPYVYLGLSANNSSPWIGEYTLTPTWNNIDEKFRMTQDAANPNLYTYTITPDMSTLFNITDNFDFNYLALIVRDKSGNKKAQDKDMFFPVTAPVDPSTVCVGNYKSHEIANGILTVTGEGGKLVITPYGDEIVKVFTLPNNASVKEERRSITVNASPVDTGLALVEDTDTELVFAVSDKCRVRIAKELCILTFTDGNGTPMLAEHSGLDNRAGKRSVTFAPMNDGAFYGGGYNGARTNWNNQSMVMNNTQKWGWEASTPNPRCINVPFYASTNGYGVLFDDHYRGATITPSAAGTNYTTGSKNPIAYYYIGGGDMEKVMENYTHLTGRQQMPPYWFLGYITSRYGYKSFNETDGYINAIKGAGIPIDGVVFDLYWQGTDESGMGNLNWEGEKFGDATNWLREKKEAGIHTTIITEPFFTSKSSNYNTLQEKGYFADTDVTGMEWLKSPQVGLLDATNPDALDWMVQNCYIPRTQEGVDGMWLDLGEPESHDDDSQHQGGSVAQVHNEFGNLWVESVYNGIRQAFPDMRPMLMPRAGTSGMQRFSTFPWTGDINRSWGGLQAQIPAMISASMSGIGYIGSDVGGFAASGYTNADLYLRWVEQAVFTPTIRTHSADKPEPTHDIYNGVREDVKRFINMHYQYLPYTYTLAWWNASKGTPLARPVNMYDANPATLGSVTDEYLWGRDILVAPVVTEGSSRQVHFPDGKWLDLNNYTDYYNGGNSINYSAALNVLPHFGRVGSFIPRFTQETFTNTASINHQEYTIDYIANPDGSVTEGFLFEDDRTTPSVNPGYGYLLTKFHGVVDNGNVYLYVWRYDQHDTDIDGTPNPVKEGYDNMPDTHTYTFVVHNYKTNTQHASVRANNGTASNEQGQDFTAKNSLEDLKSATENAYYIDNNTGKAYIKAYLPSNTHNVLTLNSNGAVITGLDEVASDSSLYLSFADGIFSYTVAPELSDARIEVYSVTGSLAAALDADDNDGTVHQTAFTAANGIYMARISATDARGNRVERHVKIAVR